MNPVRAPLHTVADPLAVRLEPGAIEVVPQEALVPVVDLAAARYLVHVPVEEGRIGSVDVPAGILVRAQ